MDYVDLGRRVRKQRIAAGWTQEKLAEQINVCTSFVGHVERGSRKASLETLVNIANTLNVSLDYLMAGSLESGGLGPVSKTYSHNQRLVMQEILSTMQTHLDEWER